MFVHHSRSARSSLEELARLTPIQLDLSKASTWPHAFGEAEFRVEPHHLPVEKMLYAVGRQRGWVAHEIVNTDYFVNSSTPIIDMGLGQMKGEFDCRRLFVTNVSNNVDYEIGRTNKWSLAALCIEDDWKCRHEMRLELNR
jgi:hypothetical protein